MEKELIVAILISGYGKECWKKFTVPDHDQEKDQAKTTRLLVAYSNFAKAFVEELRLYGESFTSELANELPGVMKEGFAYSMELYNLEHPDFAHVSSALFEMAEGGWDSPLIEIPEQLNLPFKEVRDGVERLMCEHVYVRNTEKKDEEDYEFDFY